MARILVIDDQEHIRSIIRELLIGDNHQVDLAEDGAVGMKLAARNSYDLIITDIVMPEKDGFEVINELKQLAPGIGLIVMTGGGAGLDVANLMKMSQFMGADRVLSKPLDFRILRRAVKDVLEKKS